MQMSDDSLRVMYRDSVREIEQYFIRTLRDTKFRIGEDFDRDGVVFRTERGSASDFRVFVSHEFLSDYLPAKISRQLDAWNVAEAASDLPKGFTLFITTEGTFKERTQGDSLREATRRFEPITPASSALAHLYDRVYSIEIDGVPLGDVPLEMQGDPDLYIAFSEDFATVLGAAYLLDAAGYRGFSLNRVSESSEYTGVDLAIRLASGEVAFLDYKRAVNQAERRADSMREQVNIGLRRALRDNQALADSLHGHFVQIILPSAPTTRHGVQRLLGEIERFVISKRWIAYPRSSLVPFDAVDFSSLSELGARVYIAEGTTHLSVSEGAKTFDAYAPYRIAARLIATESRRHFQVRPVWLGVSLSESPLPLPGANLESLVSDITESETPFDQIIVGSSSHAIAWRRPQLLE